MTASDKVQAVAVRLSEEMVAFAAARESILDDGRYSQEYKAATAEALKDATYATCARLAGEVFGPDGAFFSALSAARARLQAARDAAWTVVDPALVQLAAGRLPRVLDQAWTVDDVREWAADEASTFERRALALDASGLLRGRYGDAGASLARDLGRELDGELETEQVKAAQAEIEALDAAAIAAMRQVERAASLFGDRMPGLFSSRGDGDFATLLAAVVREGPGRWVRRAPGTRDLTGGAFRLS